MKVLRTFATVCLLGTLLTHVHGQGIELGKFRFGSLAMVSSKAEILQKLGQPEREYEPHYECGFFSEDEQGERFWELDYAYASFVGNDEEGYTLQSLDFTENPEATLFYENQRLNAQTTTADLNRLFGPVNTAIYQVSLEGSDAVLHFETVNGLLTRFEYWTPC